MTAESGDNKMYQYVEREGGAIVGGYTRISLRSMKHLPKVGRVRTVKGYTYYSTRRAGFDSPFTSNHTAVAVLGDKGSIRMEGLCWGYSGEGPRGLQKLFDLLGIDEDARTIAEAPTNQDTRVYWQIDIDKDGSKTLKTNKEKQ